MSLGHGASIVRNGLMLHLDAINSKSYPGSGTTWYDLSKNSNNSTLLNGAALGSGANWMSFDGTNDYVDTGMTAATLGMYDAPYTAEAVFRIPNLSGDKMVFGTPTTATRLGMHHGVRNSTFYFGHYGADAAGGTAQINTWYHVCWVWSANVASIYVNSTLVASAAAASFLGTDNIRIGSSWGVFTGDIAIAKIYNRALSSIEIKQNFEALRGRYGI